MDSEEGEDDWKLPEVRSPYLKIEGNSPISKTFKCIFPFGQVFALGSHYKTKPQTSPTMSQNDDYDLFVKVDKKKIRNRNRMFGLILSNQEAP